MQDTSVQTPKRQLAIRPFTLTAFVALTLALQGCGEGSSSPKAAGGAAPLPEVGVVIAERTDIGLLTELPGRLESSRVAEVRARAAGIVQRRLFVEGTDVKAGQSLFSIDPAPYQAAQQSAQAQLTRAEANLKKVTETVKRYGPLAAANAISQQDYSDAVAAQAQADADVAVARAALSTAGINLGYASVTSPISGRVGRALVTEGALVGQGEATPLAVVQQINPLYVNFTQPASEVMKLRRAVQAGKLKGTGESATTVRVLLDDGSVYPLPAKLLFSDLSVDAATGQISLRAEIPNPHGELLPGLYVRVQVQQARASGAISVPQQAVTRTETGNAITVVAQGGKLETRQVKIQAAANSRWVVTEGLAGGEQVVVDGFQRLQMVPPGTPVRPVPWTGRSQPGASAASAAPAASAAASRP